MAGNSRGIRQKNGFDVPTGPITCLATGPTGKHTKTSKEAERVTPASDLFH